MKSGIVDFTKVVASRTKNKYKNPNKLSFIHPTPCAVVAGFSGSGKTNFILNLMFSADTGTKMYYDRVILICPSIEEEAYTFMRDHLTSMQEAFEKKNKIKLGYKVFEHISKAEDIPDPQTFDKSLQTIVIVDDLMTSKAHMAKIESFVCSSRKWNISTIVLTQSYFQILKNIRLQTGGGYVVLFHPPSAREVSQYMQEFGTGLTKAEFIEIFKQGTSEAYVPFVIDFRSRGTEWFFRRGLLVPLGKAGNHEPDEDHLITELENVEL